MFLINELFENSLSLDHPTSNAFIKTKNKKTLSSEAIIRFTNTKKKKILYDSEML